MNDKEVKKLYYALLGKGYSTKDLGNEDAFNAKMSDEGNRKKLYDWVSRRGDFRLGDYDTYEQRLTSGESDNRSVAEPTPLGGSDNRLGADPLDTDPERSVANPSGTSATSPIWETGEELKTLSKQGSSSNRGAVSVDSSGDFNSSGKVAEVRRLRAQADHRLSSDADRANAVLRNMQEYNSHLGMGHSVESGLSAGAEKEYLTPTGLRTTNKAVADIESFNFRQAADMSVGGQLRRANLKLAELKAKRAESASRVHDEAVEDYKKNKAPLAAVLFADTYSARQMSDRENSALDVAIRQTEELIKDLEEQKDREGGIDVGYWRGFGRVAGDLRTWDFGMGDLRDAMTMVNADALTGDNATEGEREAYNEMMGAIHNKEQAEQMYSDNASFWNRAGVMTGYMPSFMLDFALTGGGFEGISLASKGGARLATKVVGKEIVDDMVAQGFKSYVKNNGVKGFGQYATNWTIKALGTTADDLLIRAPLMTNTTQLGKTTADIIDRKLGDVVVNEDGTYDFSNDKTWGSAIWQGEANAIIENYSEMFGAHLDPVITFGNMSKLANVIGAKRLGGVLAKADAGALNGVMGQTQALFNKMGVSDYFGEVTEEYYGQLWRTMLNLDDAYQQNPDGTRTNLLATGQFHGDIWGGMALSMGLMGAGKHSVSAINYASMKHGVNKADALATELLGKEIWEPLRTTIDLTANDDIGSVADGIVNDKDFTDEERAAVLTYMERSLNLRGYNLATLAEKRGGEQDDDVQAMNESYLDGYNIEDSQEMNDAKNMLEYQRQRVSFLDDDFLGEIANEPGWHLDYIRNSEAWNDEERAALLDYLNAKQVYDGMMQRVRDDIDGRIDQSNAMVDARTNRTTGMIQPATMKQDDRRVYVVNGNLVQYEDGSGIDNNASDGSIIIRDAETGTLEQVSPESILNIDTPLNPYDEKETAAEAIRQQYAQEATNKIDGVVTFNPGEVYRINVESGESDNASVADPERSVANPSATSWHLPYLGNRGGIENPIKQGGSSVADGFIEVRVVANEQGIVDNGDGTVNVSDGVNVFPIAKETIQQQVEEANLARLAQFEQARAAENAAIEAANRPQYAFNDNVTLRDDEGNIIHGQIAEHNEADDTFVLDVDSPIGGKYAPMLTRAELESMIMEHNGTAVKPIKVVAPTENTEMPENYAQNSGEIMQDGNNVAENIPENGNIDTENIPTDTQEAEQQPSAFERVPKDERRRQANLSDTSRRQQNYPPQEEIDENGHPFVISSDGTTSFGEIREESGLPAAPIKLSEGYQDENGKGYGLVHIEANHGEQIRNAGFASVEEFVSFVAKNYDEDNIRVGKRRDHIGTTTYLIQVTDEHDNTLFIELSRDGSYWNVNSGGIFRKGYSNKKETVVKTEPQQPNNAVSTGSSLSAEDKSGISTTEPNGEPTVSEGKDTTNSPISNELEEKNIHSTIGEQVQAAEAEVNTNPTDKQKEAGNYKKGHVQIGTFNVTIEQPKGSVRSGVDKGGKKWEIEMQNTYGYIRGTEGVDGDHIDVFLSDDIDGWNGRQVYVVDQRNEDGSFDEHKVMLGFNDINDAEAAYLSNYEKGWHGLGAITGVAIEDFEKWIASSHRKTKAFAEYKTVKTTEGQSSSADRLSEIKSRIEELHKEQEAAHNRSDIFEEARIITEMNELFAEQRKLEQETTSPTLSQKSDQVSDAPYNIAPAQYTTKKGKVLDMHLVKFGSTLTKEQQRAAKELAKADKGWYDSKQGGFMMRSEESAKQLAETIISNEEAVSDAQPISLADTRKVVEPKQESQPSNPSGNRLVTDERYAELRERMRKKLGGQMNIGIDPEILAIGTEMAVYHLEKGARKFTEYAKAMIADLGDAIRPYLKAFYNGARNLPEVESSEIAADMTPYDEVQQFNVASFDKEHSDPFTTAEIVVAEQAHKQEAEQAKQEIINNRNTERRKEDEQTAANTEAIASQAEAVAGEAERLIEEATTEEQINDVEQKVDEQLKAIDEQLAKFNIDDLHSGMRVILKDGRNVLLSMVMHSGEQISATQMSKPRVHRLYATYKGQFIDFSPEDVDVEATRHLLGGNKAAPVTQSEQKQEKPKKSKKKAVTLQQSGELGLFDSLFEETPTVGGTRQNESKLSSALVGATVDNETNNEDGLQRNDAERTERVSANGNRHEQGLSRSSETGSESEQQSSRGTDNEGERTGDAVDRTVRPRLSDTLEDKGIEGKRKKEVENNQKLADELKGVTLYTTDEFGVEHQVQVSNYYELENVFRCNDNINGAFNATRKELDAILKVARKSNEETTEPKNTRNNHSERGKDHAPTSVDARIDANIKAIELAKQLLESGEQATEKQMQTLRKFSGWGGLGKAFSEGTAYAPNRIAKQLRELLGEEAYQQAVMSANSAYYTPAYVVDTLWDIAEQMGFKGGNILEGSAGIGNILEQMPTHISEQSDIHAIEIDGTSGGILSLLYPDAKVEIQGFEQTRIANGSVDLAITNVPFVTGLRVKDTTGDKDLSKKFHNIHDFCIAKNVRKLREGGLGIFITSNGTLDNSKKLRDWIVSEGGADFVGAFRMHNKTFGGTGVTSDIIVIRKRVNGKKSAHAIDVSTVSGERMAEYDTGETRKVKGKETLVIKQLSMDYNRYFIEHPENMAGEMLFAFEKGDTYRPTSKGLYPKQDKKQEQMLAEFVQSFTAEEAERLGTHIETGVTDVNPGKKIGEMFVKDGKIYINSTASAQPLDVNANKVKGHTKVECFEAYAAIKEALAEVLEYQTNNEDDKGLKPLLAKLNKAYDDFVATYGHFNKNTAIAFLRNDVDYANVFALEQFEEIGDAQGNKVQKFGKTDVFSKRVVEKEKEPTPTNVKDGIIASIFKFGRIDVPYIAEHLGKSDAETKAEIIESGYGFEDPATRQLEVSYLYLSGNVREKLRQAEANNENGEYDRNIKALQDVMPMDIPAHLIDFTLGSSWIEPKLYEDYVKDRTEVGVQFTAVGGTWFMNEPYFTNYEKNRAMGVTSEMLGRTVMGHTLIEAAIQNRSITVSTTKKNWDGTTETITDKEATQACAAKIDEIRQDFKEWARQQMQGDPEMSQRMERIYNDTFNNYVPMSIPDDFVPEYFGGASHKFKMRPHQGRAIVRGTMQPLLLAHEVGTGKTFTLISTAMEMRRLGTARKPMIVVQNATVGQFVASAKELYPNAKILTLEEADRSVEGRKNFYAKIRYNDWDMIVVPQSTFEFIPDSEERQMSFVQDKIEEKMLILEKMKEADPNSNSMITRQAEREIAQLEEQLAGLSDEASKKRTAADEKKRAVAMQNAEVKAMEMLDRRTDDVENFDDMGIDALLVDEAHEYKHLGFATAMQRGVKGVDPSYSKKSQGVYLKTQAVLEKNNGRNVIFATGTPISNTAAEIWTFMRYLMPADTMEEYGIYYFDDFVRNFGNIQQMLEFTTSGKFKENNRFAGYVNLPELVRIWSGVSDTVLTKEAGGVSDKIPEMEGGKAQDLYLPQTRALRGIMKFVKAQLERYDKMSGKEKKENSHIPLTMYGIAKAAAVDARLVQSDAEDDVNSKTNEAVRQIVRALKETADYKGTVAIFADNYQNKDTGFNLYEDIRAKLIAEGVSADEIVVMKSGMTVKKKLEIFEKVNRGEVRVILGSTFTLGTGVNIQERLHTLIHLDAPNRPMDYTQRNGRILRQGNLHKAMGKPVRVLRFGVEDSLDVTAYQRLKTKGAIADSIMNGKQMMANSMTNRVLEEEEDVFGDTVAQLSGSEYAMLKNNAEKNVRKYASRKKQWEADQTYIHNAKPRIKGLIKDAEQRIENYGNYLSAVRTAFPDGKFAEIVIGKHRFTSVEAMEDLASPNHLTLDHLRELNGTRSIDDFIKEHNKSILAEVKQIKDGEIAGEQTRELPINIGGFAESATSAALGKSGTSSDLRSMAGGFTFKVKTVLHKEMNSNGGTLFAEVHRKMTYSCPELGIEDIPVRQNLLRNAIEDITKNVITGRDFAERLEAAHRNKKHNDAELELLLSREGKPFEYEAELAQAREQYEEYSELMKKELEEKEAKYAEMDATVEAAERLDTPIEDDVLYRSDDAIKDKIEALFNQAISGEFKGKPISIGRLTDAGKAYLEQISGVSFRENVDFVLNPSDLMHIYKDHFGNNEKDKGQNIPLDIEDIRSLVDVISSPDKVVFFKEGEGSNRNMFYFFKEAEDGTYNLMEIYSDRKGNLTAKTFYKTRKDATQRVMDIEKSLLPTSETYSGAILSNAKIPQMFESTSIEDDFSARDGVGSYTDDELALESDPVSNVLGKPRFTRRQRKEFAERERKRMAERVETLAKKLHLDNVEVIEEVTERYAGTGNPSGSTTHLPYLGNRGGIENPIKAGGVEAKGWYSKRSGKITIVLANHKSVADVEQTLLHEAVAHYGLRQLFGEHFDTFLDNVFNNADEIIGKRIVALRKRLYRKYVENAIEGIASVFEQAEIIANLPKSETDFTRTATEEYLASLAEQTNFEQLEHSWSWWQSLKRLFMDMLEKIGFEGFTGVTLSDNELRYLLWRSYENLAEPGRHRSILGEAADVAMQYDLKVGNYADESNGSNWTNMVADGDIDSNEARERSENAIIAEEAFKSNFNSAPILLVTKENELASCGKILGFSDEEIPEFVEYASNPDKEAAYDPVSKKIIIFAYRSKSPYIAMFHENVHHAINELTGNADFSAEWATIVKELKECRPKTYKRVQQEYDSEEVDEELICYSLERAFQRGRINSLREKLSARAQQELDRILNYIGYDEQRDTAEGVGRYEYEQYSRVGRFGHDRSGIGFSVGVGRQANARGTEDAGITTPDSGVTPGETARGGAKRGIENFENPTIEDELLYRDGDPEIHERELARQRYERRIKSGLYQSQEALQDNMLSLRDAMLMIDKKAKYIEDVAGFENAYLGENALSSVNDKDVNKFKRLWFKPMFDEVAKLARNEAERLELTDYMMAKHGLERNRKMAERDAEKATRKEIEPLEKLLKEESRKVENVNALFNKQLEQFELNELKGNLQLGEPSPILESCGIDVSNIFITPKTLKHHLEKHGLTTEDIKDLPKALQTPLMVYEWGTKAKSMVIITQIPKDDQRLTVAIKLERGGQRMEINEIASVHGKDSARFIDEMINAKKGGLEKSLKYADAENALNWLGIVPPKGTAPQTQQERVANILINFNNPKTKIDKINEDITFAKAMYDGVLKNIPQPKAQKWYDRKERYIESLYANGTITEEDYNTRIKKLNTQYSGGYLAVCRGRDYAGLTALTGMDNVADAEAEAQQMVTDYEDAHDTTDLWEKVNAVSKAILQKSYECGMMSKETFDKVSGMYEYYIPLRGFDEKTSAEAYAYLSHKQSAFNAPIKKAEGRSSKADNPFANLQSMAESAIIQGNRNKLVKQRFLNFVLNHPSDLVSVSDLWVKYNAEADEWQPVFPDNIDSSDTPEQVERKMQAWETKMEGLAQQYPDLYKHGKDAENVPYRVVTTQDLHQHQIVVKRGGRDYVLTVNGNPRLAQAVNGHTNPDNRIGSTAQYVFDVVGDAQRTLGAIYTTLQPDFIVSNFMRDITYANTMVWIKESPNYALRFNLNCAKLNPAKMKILFAKYRSGKLDMRDETEKLFYQFIENGGETGYHRMLDIDRHKKAIEKTLKAANATIPNEEARKYLGEWVGEIGRGIESQSRFAAFMTSRQFGRDMARSIYDAKEITVNFNKKGSGDKFFRAHGQTFIGNLAAGISWYGRIFLLFWNAAIQGTFGNFGKNAIRHPIKTLVAASIAYSLGYLIAAIGASDDDEDEDSNYYNLSEHTRRNNIVIKGPGKSWIKIPLPIEYRAIYGLGELCGSATFHNEEVNTHAVLSQVSQILPVDMMAGQSEDDFSWTRPLIPSVAKTYVEAQSNRSWTGLPIWKDTPYNKNMPEWTKAYRNANKQLVGLSEALNAADGKGDDYRKGTFDFNPAKVEYLLSGYLGGFWNLPDQLIKTYETVIGERDFDWRYLPLVNRAITNGDERTAFRDANNRYYKLKEERDETMRLLRSYENASNQGVFEYAEKIDFLYNSPEHGRALMFDTYNKDIMDLEKLIKEAPNDSVAEDFRRIQNEMKRVLVNAVDEMNQTRGRKEAG